MSGQEALQMIAAIAEWVDEAPLERADCSDRIRRLHAMTATTDFAALSDSGAMRLFSDVRQVLRN